MKKFDLEKAKAGEPICTREGTMARIIDSNIDSDVYPIAVAYRTTKNPNSEERVETYTREGYRLQNQSEDPLDLFMAPQQCKRWMNVYRDITKEEPYSFGAPQLSKETAEALGCDDPAYIATVEIRWRD